MSLQHLSSLQISLFNVFHSLGAKESLVLLVFIVMMMMMGRSLQLLVFRAAGWDSEMMFSLCEPDSSGHHSRMLAEYEN